MKIRKAVITAAGPDQRELPLQRLIDRDGTPKSALRIVLDQAAGAGVLEIAVVVHPADRAAYAAAAGEPGPRISFVAQEEPRGYGHALLCAREFVGGEPFLHLVGDHLWVGRDEHGGAKELVALAEKEDAAVCAVQATRESQLKYFGAVGGTRLPGRTGVYAIDAVLEKPTPTQAEQKLFVPGLRAGHYLCFFGMHLFSPGLLPLLADEVAKRADGGTLSRALARLAAQERVLALEIATQRFNLGEKYGLLIAQLALALAGRDRDDVLTQMTELLAARERGR